MCLHPYALERIAAIRLEELRSEAARRGALSSMRRERFSLTRARGPLARAFWFLVHALEHGLTRGHPRRGGARKTGRTTLPSGLPSRR